MITWPQSSSFLVDNSFSQEMKRSILHTSSLLILVIIIAALTSVAASSSRHGPSHSRISNQVSVKSYGAVGDGVTDDTAAILLATEALISGAIADAENVLVFPIGSYLFASAPTTPNATAYISIPPLPHTTFTISGVAIGEASLLWNVSYGYSLFNFAQPGAKQDNNLLIEGSQLVFQDMEIISLVPQAQYPEPDAVMMNIIGLQNITMSDCIYIGKESLDAVVVYQISGTNETTFQAVNMITSNCDTAFQFNSVGSSVIKTSQWNNVSCSINLQSIWQDSVTMNGSYTGMQMYNIQTGVSLSGDPTELNPTMNVFIKDSVFLTNLNLDPRSNASMMMETIAQGSPGVLVIENSVFQDLTHNRIHIFTQSYDANYLSITNSTISGGSLAFLSLCCQKATILLQGNTFIGPWFMPNPISLFAETLTFQENTCQNANGGGEQPIMELCSGTGEMCVIEQNQGCNTTQA